MTMNKQDLQVALAITVVGTFLGLAVVVAIQPDWIEIRENPAQGCVVNFFKEICYDMQKTITFDQEIEHRYIWQNEAAPTQ